MVSVCSLSNTCLLITPKNISFNMKFLVVALSLLAVAAAAPTNPDAAVKERRKLPALEHEEIHDESGQFALRYVTAEGTVVSERGRLVPNPNGTDYVMIVEGEVSYISDDGETYVTKYTAGLDGTQARRGFHRGNHLLVSVTPEPITAPEPMIVSEPVEVIAEPFKRVAERL